MRKVFVIGPEDLEKRIDIFLSRVLPKMSRSQIQKLIGEGLVEVNNVSTKANYKLKEHDEVVLSIPEPKELDVEPENLDIEILFEDTYIAVVNKPQGMVVHPAPGNYSGTLVNALLYHCKDLSGINGVLRPGIVHRIDKDTSGVLVIAKNDLAHTNLAAQIKEHSVNRIYKALVCGSIKEPAGIIKTTIGRHPVDRKKMAVGVKNAKVAETHFTVLESFKNYTYVEARLKTGRTHQIRVHMSYINHPVVGDPKYSKGKNNLGFTGQALHAEVLGFIHPGTNKYMEFKAPLPEYFERALAVLRRGLGE
ncbi:RluA family pseudouridine synthase [Desulfitibacter alkalitolerans]|uniref:RluA family pseudouridine synthase n=1 Tax=Desulfitibacter alkalitolerans TaxID=264641 RepID=UPI000486F4DB|nr:RluA family pseudouridine synthase [Desulfitibacter alkalitolerans]